jgi:hypothetical protein
MHRQRATRMDVRQERQPSQTSLCDAAERTLISDACGAMGSASQPAMPANASSSWPSHCRLRTSSTKLASKLLAASL